MRLRRLKRSNQSCSQQKVVKENAAKFTIAEHLDPDREISRNADPLVEYTNYLSDVNSGTVRDMGFTLEDFDQRV